MPGSSGPADISEVITLLIQKLVKQGDSLFAAPTDQTPSAVPIGSIRVMQGIAEGSNVRAVIEMSRIIEINRAYSSLAALIQNNDEMRKSAVERLADIPSYGARTMRALHTAATGMAAQELNVEVISNNIANMSTTGFKRQRAEFQDLLYETCAGPGRRLRPGTMVPTGIQIGSGVKTAATPPRHARRATSAPTEKRARRRHPRRGLLPRPAAGRPHRLHPRRLLRARPRASW